ncbi:hypothetical protein LPJ61_000645 [Coemansia biformis]|uniref:Uncharacterized protein n=1 Tax=Coemansia biformis TaxID=1286918 RepID=A0A9W8D1E8_9FUNG|nr:hypothetical protein LPJ61_000645 [Coemansia biformis]
MSRRDAGLAPMPPPPPPPPPPLEVPCCSQQPQPEQQQRQGVARANGLLKIFRRGPPKHPKLNPVGISSKDFFASEPRSAPALALAPAFAPPPAPAPIPARRGTKLERRLSALPPAPARAATPQSLTPMTAAAAVFSTSASGCFSDSDVPSMRTSGAVQSAVRAGADDAAGDRKRRGSLWRAKLSFTNTRRPETRQQRHQSFDINAVDIAAHPRMFAESPLVSLPTAAPATAHPRTSSQRLADTLLEVGIDIAVPHSAAAAAPEDVAAVGGLAAIDRDFLLTIQRNSALEARRQRRRETRRSTMSVLAAADGDAPQARNAPARLHRLGSDACGGERTWDKGSASRDCHAAASPPGIGHQPVPAYEYCETAVWPSPAAADAGGSSSASAGGGPEPFRSAATASPPTKPRPASLDYTTCSGAHAFGSSRSARSSHDGAQPRAVASPHRLAPSEISQAVVKEAVSRAAFASSAAAQPTPGAGHPPPPADNPLAVEPPHPAASADMSPPSSRRRSARSIAPSIVPPVPPLPRHIAAHGQRPTARDTLPLPLPERPATARARASPRQDSDSRKHRGSAAVAPSSLLMSVRSDPTLTADAQLRHDLAAQLQGYSMAPASAGLGLETNASGTHAGADGDTEPGAGGAARKFGHPEDQPRHASSAQSSPMHSPGLFSKSAASLSARISIESSRFKPRDGGTSATLPHRHGLGRLFSPSPPSRKSQQSKRPQQLNLCQPSLAPEDPSALLRPTSPAVASLVDDPSARRKIRDQLASSMAFDRLLEEDDEFVMAISLTPTVAGMPLTTPRRM